MCAQCCFSWLKLKIGRTKNGNRNWNRLGIGNEFRIDKIQYGTEIYHLYAVIVFCCFEVCIRHQGSITVETGQNSFSLTKMESTAIFPIYVYSQKYDFTFLSFSFTIKNACFWLQQIFEKLNLTCYAMCHY